MLSSPCSYLLTNRGQPRSVNDIMPMIGARFYTQLDAAQLRSDVLENEIAKVRLQTSMLAKTQISVIWMDFWLYLEIAYNL